MRPRTQQRRPGGDTWVSGKHNLACGSDRNYAGRWKSSLTRTGANSGTLRKHSLSGHGSNSKPLAASRNCSGSASRQRGLQLGQRKINVSVRMMVEDRASLQAYANRERRTLGNLSEILLTWALEKLKRAGGTEKLIARRLPIPRNANGNYRRLSIEEQRQRK